jgi:hypothetical protein
MVSLNPSTSQQEDTLKVPSSHTSRKLHVNFDAQHLVADAGLLLPSTLAQRLGLPELFEQYVDLGQAAGRANVAAKAMTLIASLHSGGDCIDDADAVRAGSCEAVLGHRALAASTLGTFLRSFTWGHSKQLDLVSTELLHRAWAAGAGPGDGPLTIDLDSTICETFGVQKQGAKRVNYANVHGYHPLLAVAAGRGEVLHARLRGGTANSSRGVTSFLKETLKRVRRAGATGSLLVRADSGFYTEDLVRTCRQLGAKFSITVRLFRRLYQRIAEIPEADWQSIPWPDGSAEVAEISYLAFANSHHGSESGGIPARLIVRRVQPREGSQLQLHGILYRYHAFITDQQGNVLDLEADHRRHAAVENVIRELKYGVGLNHLPSGRFGANAAWLALNQMAHNLIRWIARLGLEDDSLNAKTLRRRLFSVPARLVRSARRWQLRLPRHWPWERQFLVALQRLRGLEWRTPVLA